MVILRRSIIARSPPKPSPGERSTFPMAFPPHRDCLSPSQITATLVTAPSRPDFPSWAARSSARTPLSHLSSGATLSPCGRDQVQLVSNQNVTSSLNGRQRPPFCTLSSNSENRTHKQIDSTSQTITFPCPYSPPFPTSRVHHVPSHDLHFCILPRFPRWFRDSDSKA